MVNEADVHDVQAARGGDDDAFARIVRRYQQDIAKRLWRFTRNRGELDELVQETFVQAWTSLQSYRGDAPFDHWLTRIATRVGYRHWKNAWKQRQRTDGAPIDNLAAPAADDSPAEAAQYVHHLLDQLPPRDRMVLTLIYLEQCTIDQAAKRTGWSSTMVKVQAHRARAKLRKLIEQTED